VYAQVVAAVEGHGRVAASRRTVDEPRQALLDDPEERIQGTEVVHVLNHPTGSGKFSLGLPRERHVHIEHAGVQHRAISQRGPHRAVQTVLQV